MEDNGVESRSIGWLWIVLGGVFLLAVGLKLAAVIPFARVVASFIPGVARTYPVVKWATLAILGVEALLGSMLVLRIGGRRVLACTGVLLLLFTAALVELLFQSQPASCGCLGVGRGSGRADAAVGIVRNGAMLWVTCH